MEYSLLQDLIRSLSAAQIHLCVGKFFQIRSPYSAMCPFQAIALLHSNYVRLMCLLLWLQPGIACFNFTHLRYSLSTVTCVEIG